MNILFDKYFFPIVRLILIFCIHLCRMSHESIVDQQIKCTQNLPFEVIALPQYDGSQLVNNAKNKLIEAINIKIKVRNKEEVGKKYGFISVPKLSANRERKVRLASSDQTIMSFNFFVEPDRSKKKEKKIHKNIFHIFRPGGCLRIQSGNDDEYPYSPNSLSEINKMKSTSSTVEKQSNIISEKITLKKNFPSIIPTDRVTKTTTFMGESKPGGCLDPPFNEDKYSYEPVTKLSNVSVKNKNDNKNDLLMRGATTDSLNTENVIEISIQELNEKKIETQIDNKFYQENYSHLLITYPTDTSDNDLQIYNKSHDMKLTKRISGEDKARISINEFSEIYFMPPKKDRKKNLEKKHNETNFDIENKTSFDNKNSEHSLINHNQLEPHNFIIETDIDKLKFNIGEDKRCSFTNEPITDIDNFSHCSILEIIKSVELIQNVKTPVLKSYNIKADSNIISNKHSEIDTVKVKEFKFDNNVTYSQNTFFRNSSTNSTNVQIKEIEELGHVLTGSKESFEKKSDKIDHIEEINSPSLKKKDIQNRDTNNNTNYSAGPVTKTKDGNYSLRLSQESFKIEIKEITDTHKIKVPSLKSLNIGSNHVIVASNDFEQFMKDSGEFFVEKLEEIANTDEIKATLSKSTEIAGIDTYTSNRYTVIELIESKHSLKISQEAFIEGPEDIIDLNDEEELFVKNIQLQNSETNTSTFGHAKGTTLIDTKLNEKEKNDYEKPFELDNIFLDDDQLLRSTEDFSNSMTREKQKTMDILNKERDDDIATKLSADKNNLINIYIIPDDSSHNKSVKRATIDFNQTSKVNNSISLIQDKTDETNHKTFHEEKIVSTLELPKNWPWSESLNSTLGSKRNIEVDYDKGFNGLNKSNISVVYKISEPIKNQTTEIKHITSFENLNVVEDIDDKHKSIFNATHSYNEQLTKKLELNVQQCLYKNSIKSKRPIDTVKDKTDIKYIVKPSHDDGVDVSTYSSIVIDFGFRCSVDSENKLIVHTFDPSISSHKNLHDKISVIKSIIRTNDDEIRIPLNFDTDLTIQIQKAEVTVKDIISKKQNKAEEDLIKTLSERNVNQNILLQETLNSVYGNLIPLNMIIQNLKEEANSLSHQQTSLKEILERMEIKPKRLIHTDHACRCDKK